VRSNQVGASSGAWGASLIWCRLRVFLYAAIDRRARPACASVARTHVLSVQLRHWPGFVGLAAVIATLAACDRGAGNGEPDPALVPEWGALSSTLLVPRGSAWRYVDDGSDQGTAWRDPAFADTGWKTGAAQLGYGDGDEATVVSYGGNPDAKFITTYFRRSFTVTQPGQFGRLTLRVLRDDGAVAYLNGIEVFRSNLPAGPIGYRTLASANSPDEARYLEVTLDAVANPALVRVGTNLLAVEVHQYSQWSSDAGFDAELAGEPAPAPTPPPAGRPHVDSWMVHYGRWDAASIALAQRHQLVVTHPRGAALTRAEVAQIQSGVSASDPADDVKVLCYVSVGEDLRSSAVTDAQARADARFRGDGTGPRVDPRGPNADGKALAGIDPRGAPSNGGSGFASFYLDDNSVDCSGGAGDGIPDRNANFHAYFVNAGDPGWFPVIDAMTLDSADGVTGFREALTTGYGRGLDCDGVFLDTVDTAAPNHYTSCGGGNQSEFEWTAPGMSSFVRRLRAAYPGKLIMQNRGLFFLDPRHPQYQFTTRGAIDFVLFESYRLNSSSSELWNAYFYPDNRFNIAPKLVAEASRGDGFQVLSLGYAEGPSNLMSRTTLLGQSTLGFGELIEDIRVTQDLVGFRHYLTDWRIVLVNTFARDNGNLADSAPPVWTSTFNDHQVGYPNPPGEATARPGVRAVIAGSRMLTARWDVAIDKFPVGYAVYYKAGTFDFTADPLLTTATRLEVAPMMPTNYPGWGGPTIVANEATIGGLTPGQTYSIVVRAFDRSPARNEERNQIVLTGVPLP
jgi:hypothetical protein